MLRAAAWFCTSHRPIPRISCTTAPIAGRASEGADQHSKQMSGHHTSPGNPFHAITFIQINLRATARVSVDITLSPFPKYPQVPKRRSVAQTRRSFLTAHTNINVSCMEHDNIAGDTSCLVKNPLSEPRLPRHSKSCESRGHLLKLVHSKRYRGDQNGPSAKMTGIDRENITLFGDCTLRFGIYLLLSELVETSSLSP